jgi:hypothetical protein
MGHGKPPSSPGDADYRRHAILPGVDPDRGDPGMTHGAAFWFHCCSAVLRRPHLWFAAVRQISRAVPMRWWTRSPFVPLPDRAYVRFRLETAYGKDASPRVADVLRYLEWCRGTE